LPDVRTIPRFVLFLPSSNTGLSAALLRLCAIKHKNKDYHAAPY
jgi:hypothetical protein